MTTKINAGKFLSGDVVSKPFVIGRQNRTIEASPIYSRLYMFLTLCRKSRKGYRVGGLQM